MSGAFSMQIKSPGVDRAPGLRCADYFVVFSVVLKEGDESTQLLKECLRFML